jgi:hypothetical protein
VNNTEIIFSMMASSIFRINLRKSFYLLVENKTLTKKKSQIVALTDAEIIWKLLLTGQSKSIGDMLPPTMVKIKYRHTDFGTRN